MLFAYTVLGQRRFITLHEHRLPSALLLEKLRYLPSGLTGLQLHVNGD